ncbi:tyrosine-type recombinase/integrase [Klebsiella sp. HSTU-Sny5]|uniref:tyrosine-type recombinase/integrase n=1 Tax=Klebsiella sp. HSTU-Sny5 TaxID=2663238 RepID=UPI001FB688EF|nr:phage integrase SAM-like domain-containing protein [Klebsiella sp. HSTU-Sny5]
MNPSKIKHTSYTEKNGYVWRKRTTGGSLSISLQTRDENEAIFRANALTLRFLSVEASALPFETVHSFLKAYRDEVVRNRKIAALTKVVSSATNSQFPNVVNGLASPTALVLQGYDAIDAQIELQELTEASPAGHTMESVKEEYIADKSREWRPRTKRNNERAIDLFIAFSATQNILTIEDVTKPHISEYKNYLDDKYPAPATRKQNLTDVSSFFRFCVVQRDYLSKNPFDGMQYKNVKTTNVKEEVKPEEYAVLMARPDVQNDRVSKYMLAMFYHTGMRISELHQITKADYIEERGIKCISINDEGDGKTVKTHTSIRIIPLNDALLNLGIWDVKPEFRMTTDQIGYKLKKLFKLINIKRSSHCFRYGIQNRLREHDVPDSVRAFITGHSQNLLTDRVYINRLPLEQMKRALDLAAS